MLEHYKKKLAKLRLDRVSGRWGANTNNFAPYKPFLLLAIMDMIAQQQITTNFVNLDAELIDALTSTGPKSWAKTRDATPYNPSTT